MSPIANSSVLELPPRARRIQVKPFFPRLRGGTTSACAENTEDFLFLYHLGRNYLRVRGEYCELRAGPALIAELPPRARRIPITYKHGDHLRGTTSACAENTTNLEEVMAPQGNYLRVRGEYFFNLGYWHDLVELPPRARRIPGRQKRQQPHEGTTSACAENTGFRLLWLGLIRNYLRVRGEYAGLTWTSSEPEELPPRARRIRYSYGICELGGGTTSACAENTGFPAGTGRNWRNYLRVRGEYPGATDSGGVGGELPPRARRIPRFHQAVDKLIGTTSACAENTPHSRKHQPRRRNYLRVRGEYNSCCLSSAKYRELPPRARRILSAPAHVNAAQGTTSACAENTSLANVGKLPVGNYLRVRGEYPGPTEYRPHHQELPPRARRIPIFDLETISMIGTTSACAENTLLSPSLIGYHWNYLRVRGEYSTPG